MNNIFNKSKKIIILTIIILILFSCLYYSKTTIIEVINTINIFINSLLPGIFIFYTITDLLVNYDFLKVLYKLPLHITKRLLNITTNSLFIISFSLLSGFPSGSKYITSFYNQKLIDKNETSYLLLSTHFSNPLFILGVIKTIIGKKLALIVLLSHYLSNFILIIFFHPKEKHNNKIKSINHYDLVTCLNKSFNNTFHILLIVLSYSIIFATLSTLICMHINSNFVKIFVYGFIDITKGIFYLKELNIPLYIKGLLITTFITFGGVNIHMQVKSIIKKESLNYSYFFIGRIISTFLSIILYIFLFNVL